MPIRTGKFVARKNWIIIASDDQFIRVYDYNTSEQIHQFVAHDDFIRSIIVHPTQSYLLSASDDMTIKLWDWDAQWTLKQTFQGHTHYVMHIAINPKDGQTFASASLDYHQEDGTVKLWNSESYHLESTLQYDVGRCWSMSCSKSLNYVVLGYDQGTLIIQVDQEKRNISMDHVSADKKAD
ncbi:unnamed protein product [Didymodactylos carnosus]|uniref:Coatomer beta' subunit n=1 Tax=Didymodactylos carnosus TaxID=1234261 RepID=A0A815BE56_9BILA|nr:unnamed protein product [Didymodactylos carnosus]CAF1268957.1 unnamed protein product [Didymodactylos carnosus]CAF3634364.1 unnamed protein product [Didymodactylos carnosus]CAF4055143.1 unnamed protein product [Didymodactylos carnosus]